MDKLKDLEAVAYVRFASVYREFKDINTFMDELKKILDKQEELLKFFDTKPIFITEFIKKFSRSCKTMG